MVLNPSTCKVSQQKNDTKGNFENIRAKKHALKMSVYNVNQKRSSSLRNFECLKLKVKTLKVFV